MKELEALREEVKTLTSLVTKLIADGDKKDRLLRTQLKIMEVNNSAQEPKPRIMLTDAQIVKIRLLIDLNDKGRVKMDDRKKVDTFKFYLRNGERDNFVPFVTMSQQRMLNGLFDYYLTPDPQTNDDANFENYDDEMDEEERF